MSALLAGLATAAVVLVLGLSARPPLRRVPEKEPAARLLSSAELTTALVRGGTRLLDRLRPARRLARRDAQLPDALDRLASSLRAGRALGPALGDVGRSLPDPLGRELRQLTEAHAHGAAIAAAAAEWARRPDASRDVRLVAAALALGADAGGEVARAVDRVAATLRERRELLGEARSLATQARASAGVLAVTPLAFTAFVSMIEPATLTFLVTTPVGLVCLVLGAGLQALGAGWMARITRSAA